MFPLPSAVVTILRWERAIKREHRSVDLSGTLQTLVSINWSFASFIHVHTLPIVKSTAVPEHAEIPAAVPSDSR